MNKVKRNEWIQKRIQLGICLQCGKKSGPKSNRYCNVCVEKFNDNAKKRAKKLKSTGLCVRCQCVSITKSRCSECLQKERQERKDKRNIREMNGLCIKCGSKTILPGVRNTGLNKCETCCLKAVAWSYFKETGRWRELKTLFDKQKGICPFSGRKISIGLDAELDHIIPRSKDGSDELTNLQWTHSDVNKMKSNQFSTDFLKLVKEIYDFSVAPCL